MIITAEKRSFLCYCCGSTDEDRYLFEPQIMASNHNNNKMKKLNNIFAPRKGRNSEAQNGPASPTVDTLHRIVNAKEEVRSIHANPGIPEHTVIFYCFLSFLTEKRVQPWWLGEIVSTLYSIESRSLLLQWIKSRLE